MKNRLITKPRKLSRIRATQARTVAHFSVKDMKETFRELFTGKRHIYIGGVKKEKIHAAKEPFLNNIDITFTKSRHHRIALGTGKHAFLVAFRIPSLEGSIRTNFALKFLAREIYENMRESAWAVGSYEPYYEQIIRKGHGILWFGLSSYIKPQNMERLFFVAIQTTLRSAEIGEKIGIYKKQIAMMIKRDWSNRVERQDWIVDDYVNLGSPIDVKWVLDELGRVDTRLVRDVARKILARNKAYVFEG